MSLNEQNQSEVEEKALPSSHQLDHVDGDVQLINETTGGIRRIPIPTQAPSFLLCIYCVPTIEYNILFIYSLLHFVIFSVLSSLYLSCIEFSADSGRMQTSLCTKLCIH